MPRDGKPEPTQNIQTLKHEAVRFAVSEASKSVKMTSYLVRASFGELEFTSCEINRLHICAKPKNEAKKTPVFKITLGSANKELTICMCSHTHTTLHQIPPQPSPHPPATPVTVSAGNQWHKEARNRDLHREQG